MKSHWTVLTSIATLCALCLSTVVVYNFLTDRKVLENQKVMAQENPANDTVAELRVRLFEAKQELKKVQKKHLELQQKLEKALASQKAYELKLAEIISGQDSGVKINESLLKELVALREKSGLTSQQFEELNRYVLNSYNLLKADETVKEKLTAKAALIRVKLASLLTAGNLQKREKGLVLNVNEDLKVVAISLGYGDGVTQGSEWQVKEAEKILASLKIVEVRKSISLGILTQGKLKDVPQGASVEKIVKSK